MVVYKAQIAYFQQVGTKKEFKSEIYGGDSAELTGRIKALLDLGATSMSIAMCHKIVDDPVESEET